MKKYKIILLFLVMAIISSCATFKMERKLAPQFKDWYWQHVVLMETKIPTWLDASGPLEKLHFLRLPNELKVAYIQYFWKIRQEGTREVFEWRVRVADEAFNDEGILGRLTDRGRVFILCGQPLEVFYYNEYGQDFSAMSAYLPTSSTLMMWAYWQYGAGYARYVFQFVPPSKWQLSYSNLFDMGYQLELERQNKRFFAPTEEGLMEWGAFLVEWQKKKQEAKK